MYLCGRYSESRHIPYGGMHRTTINNQPSTEKLATCTDIKCVPQAPTVCVYVDMRRARIEHACTPTTIA